MSVDSVAPMTSDLDHDSPVPLWKQLADHLRRDITAGELTGKLRGEHIAAQYDVSRDTVRRAIAELTTEGLVEAVVGRGTFVVRRDGRPPE